MSLRKLFITSALAFLIVAAPVKASADWLFTPFVGMNFGGAFNDDFGDFEDEFENRGTFGASLAWMGGGIAGFELDFGYTPNFFEVTEGDADFDFGENNVTTLMANIVLGVPAGGQTGTGIRPYASGGAGIIRSRIDAPDDFFDVSSNDWGFNVGGGIAGFFTDNIGLRGDVRYFRSIAEGDDDDDDDDDDILDDDLFDVRLGSFRFWRGSVGLTFRF